MPWLSVAFRIFTFALYFSSIWQSHFFIFSNSRAKAKIVIHKSDEINRFHARDVIETVKEVVAMSISVKGKQLETKISTPTLWSIFTKKTSLDMTFDSASLSWLVESRKRRSTSIRIFKRFCREFFYHLFYILFQRSTF